MPLAVVEKTSSYLVVFEGWPLWLQVLVGTLVAAVGLWLFVKVLKWTVWLLIVLVVVGGLAAAVWCFFNPNAAPHL